MADVMAKLAAQDDRRDGMIGAVAASSTLGSLLYEINALDPTTYVTVAAALAATALLASWLPALRASSVDPVVALRSD